MLKPILMAALAFTGWAPSQAVGQEKEDAVSYLYRDASNTLALSIVVSHTRHGDRIAGMRLAGGLFVSLFYSDTVTASDLTYMGAQPAELFPDARAAVALYQVDTTAFDHLCPSGASHVGIDDGAGGIVLGNVNLANEITVFLIESRLEPGRVKFSPCGAFKLTPAR